MPESQLRYVLFLLSNLKSEKGVKSCSVLFSSERLMLFLNNAYEMFQYINNNY